MPDRSGHTVIQMDKRSQNNILLLDGANRNIPRDFADEMPTAFGEGNLLLLQSEISGIPRLVESAHAYGMRIASNPSPHDEVISECNLSKVSVLLINETEG